MFSHAYDESTLSLPRILCLHGGGVNGTVFRIQCRAIIERLRHKFRFVFMDAPFPSVAHDAILSFFGAYAPFYRWLRWQEVHPEISDEDAAQLTMDQCREAMEGDAGTGAWVGLLGFSQGAKVAASLLWAQERMAREQPGAEYALANFRFGVLMAGSAPVVKLDSRIRDTPPHVAGAGLLTTAFDEWPADDDNMGEHALTTPTLHVHGLQDPGLERQVKLMDTYCRPGTAKLVQWDGGHRLPIKQYDVTLVVDKMLELASETSVKWGANQAMNGNRV